MGAVYLGLCRQAAKEAQAEARRRRGNGMESPVSPNMGSGSSDDDMPDEFRDPILMTPMSDPVMHVWCPSVAMELCRGGETCICKIRIISRETLFGCRCSDAHIVHKSATLCAAGHFVCACRVHLCHHTICIAILLPARPLLTPLVAPQGPVIGIGLAMTFDQACAIHHLCG